MSVSSAELHEKEYHKGEIGTYLVDAPRTQDFFARLACFHRGMQKFAHFG